MQELIEWLDESIETLEKHGSFTIAAGIRAAKGQADNLVKKEKEQIIDAYSEGYGDGVQEPNPNDKYYDQTYNQKK